MTIFTNVNRFDPGGNRISRLFGRAALEGMWPWVAIDISVFTDYDMDNDEYRLKIEASVGVDTKIWGDIRIGKGDVLRGDDWIFQTYPRIVDAFRTWPAEPVSDNIVLGED